MRAGRGFVMRNVCRQSNLSRRVQLFSLQVLLGYRQGNLQKGFQLAQRSEGSEHLLLSSFNDTRIWYRDTIG